LPPASNPQVERVIGVSDPYSVRTVRTECLDWMLVLGRRHVEQVLRTYAAHYNGRRPHRGLDLNTPYPRPDPAPLPAKGARVRARNILGGLIY
jgi:hypothetical protein